ncbi:MAG: nuclear transport factor 2 family protein [Clostridiales bacterium]|nr:nuclear transport factor 2 family protein [Clostridiales bacterium]
MKTEIMKTLLAFEEGYKTRRLNHLDDFMKLFSDEADTQMIGIGATIPGAYEWFTGKSEIKEIIESDWTYWGAVHFDLENIRLTEKNGVAWFSLCATLEQLESNEEAWTFYENQMKELFENKDLSAHDRMFEATHFGIRRIRERNLGVGHEFPMVITGTLVKDNTWKFHTLHWSMPVD